MTINWLISPNFKKTVFLAAVFLFLFFGGSLLAAEYMEFPECMEFPEGNAGSCTVTLTCDDNPLGRCGIDNSCCDKIYYCIYPTDTCSPSTPYNCPGVPCSVAVNVTNNGTNYVRYYSVDKAGNPEETKSIKICIGCVIGGNCYENDTCNPTNKCQLCNTSKNLTSWSNISSGYVCTTSGKTPVSSTNYCNYGEDCDAGDCVAQKWWTSCDGSGSCRPAGASPPPDSYSETVYASAGRSLTSTCGTTGTTLCDSTWRASSGTGDNHYGKGGDYTCQGMCDGSGKCEYAANCGVCAGTLNVSISGAGTCTVTASLTATDCGGKSWQVKDDGTTKCSGTVSSNPYSYTCSTWTVGVGSYTYNLYIDGEWQDSASVTCQAGFDFSIDIKPPSGSVMQGESVSTNVTATLVSGTTETVYFSASGLPSGATYSFSPTDNCNPTCTRTMTIFTSLSTPTGSYQITVCGINFDGTVIRCFYYYDLTVTAAGVEITPPQVTTNPATDISQTSATLNGTLNSMGNADSCLVWFEWGTTPSYGNSTSVQTMTSTGSFSANISGLSPNTTYYFEAYAKNGGSW